MHLGQDMLMSQIVVTVVGRNGGCKGVLSIRGDCRYGVLGCIQTY